MSKYAAGRRLEYEVQDVLAPNGYQHMRAAGSKGPHKIDVIAWKRGERIVIQCKKDGDVRLAERVTFLQSAYDLQATPLVAYWHKDGNAARVVRFDELTGPGPKDRRPWTPDWAVDPAPDWTAEMP